MPVGQFLEIILAKPITPPESSRQDAGTSTNIRILLIVFCYNHAHRMSFRSRESFKLGNND